MMVLPQDEGQEEQWHGCRGSSSGMGACRPRALGSVAVMAQLSVLTVVVVTQGST